MSKGYMPKRSKGHEHVYGEPRANDGSLTCKHCGRSLSQIHGIEKGMVPGK